MPATPAWLAAVEALLNRGVQASMPASALARRLDATSLRVDIEGVLPIRASVTGGRLSLVAADRSPESAASEQVNATIAGSPFALLQLAAPRGGVSSKIRHTPAQVRGDAEIANLYRQLFAMARPDMEEELSRIVGDLAARRLSQFARQTAAWVRRARRPAGENIAEYLQEESRDLVNKTELEEFLQGVDMLRETADRVEARIARLEQRLKGSA
jgi:ubiquinone biosynthesis protein UbiJ